MKKLLPILLYILSAQVQAQDFGAVGSEWYYSFLPLDSQLPMDAEYYYLQSVADTIILGKTAHKITITHYRYDNTAMPAGSRFVYQQGDTVYYYSAERARFLSQFIFNQNPGDTLTLDSPQISGTDSTYRLLIDSVSTELVSGIPVKYYHTTNLDYWGEFGSFADRIGGLGWFELLGSMPAVPGGSGPIRCYKDSQVTINVWNRPCDFRITGMGPEFNEEPMLSAYPNPFTNTISLKFPAETLTHFYVSLYNLQGQKVYTSEQKNTDADEIQLTIPALPAGLYFLHVSGQQISRIVKLQRQ